MSGQAELAVFDGAIVRMFVGFARWRSVQAARRSGRELAVEQMLFEAGRSIVTADLFAGFWRDEAGEMDWLEDFLCDPAMDEMMGALQAPEKEEDFDEPEMLFTKTMLVTTGTDMYDYS